MSEQPERTRPGVAATGPMDTGPAAGSGDHVVADVDRDTLERIGGSDDGPAGTIDSGGGDLDEAGA